MRATEDCIVVSADHVAVVDGATAKGNFLWNGMTSGRFAAGLLHDVIVNLDAGVCLHDFVRLATEAIRCAYRDSGRAAVVLKRPWERVSACAAVYSAVRGEVWLVGDCQCLVGGQRYGNAKRIDGCLAKVRSEIDGYLLEHGWETDGLRKWDIGREMIADALKTQMCFQNAEPYNEFSYCVIDGFEPHADFPVVNVGDAKEIVLATDGYPELLPTLAESEEYLKGVLESDPLCISFNKQTKGVAYGACSYDDRSYVRFECR